MAVTTAQHALDTANANLAGATLTAPVAGTVGSIAFSVGGAATTNAGVVIIGKGAAVVTVDVPLTMLPRIEKGGAATVTPAGATTGIPGVVGTIGLLPASTSGSSPTYAVTVVVADSDQALSTGARADVALVVSRRDDVLTLPASAVTTVSTTGSTSTGVVRVLANGVVTTTRVTTGAVGGGLVEVSAGLTAGQTVVLADTTAALPASSTTTPRLAGTGLGGVGGATGFGGTPGFGGTSGFGGGTGGFGGGTSRGGGAGR